MIRSQLYITSRIESKATQFSIMELISDCLILQTFSLSLNISSLHGKDLEQAPTQIREIKEMNYSLFLNQNKSLNSWTCTLICSRTSQCRFEYPWNWPFLLSLIHKVTVNMEKAFEQSVKQNLTILHRISNFLRPKGTPEDCFKAPCSKHGQ